MATQVHIVSGKGGTGKTTVAAALAMALAGKNRKVLLVEVERRQGIAQIFDIPPLTYAEKPIGVGLGGGKIYGLSVEPEEALLEYLQMYYKLGRAGRALEKFGVMDFVTTIAPGLRDVLLTGKVYEAARRLDGQNYVYDAVVLDAPPTGRITRFLNVNQEVAGLAKVGPIKKQADSIMTMMRAATTRVHLTTLLEPMPAQETLDAIAELSAAKLPLGHIIINRAEKPLLNPAQRKKIAGKKISVAKVQELLASVDVETSHAANLLTEGRMHVQRLDLEDEQRAALAESDYPRVELPEIPDGIDLGALFDLAERLKRVVE